MSKLFRAVVVPTAIVSLATLSACAVLQPGEPVANSQVTVEVSTSTAKPFVAKKVPRKEITDPNREWVKDEGLGVSWKLQGLYPDNYRGSVVTILVRNDNPQALPPEAIKQPVLEYSDGSDGWIKVDPLKYDPELNSDVLPPGLDIPLGSQAATNLQYRFDATVGTLWKARLTIGNVTWIGNLNV